MCRHADSFSTSSISTEKYGRLRWRQNIFKSTLAPKTEKVFKIYLAGVGVVIPWRQVISSEIGSTETSDRRPATGDRLPATGDRRPATGDRRPATGDRRPATGDRLPATGDRRPATGDRRPATGDQRKAYRRC